MLHTVVVDAEALARLDALFSRSGFTLPRSAPVVSGSTLQPAPAGLAWHAIPIDAPTVSAIQRLRTSETDTFNDCLRNLLELPPLSAYAAKSACAEG